VGGWSALERVGEKGREALYRADGLRARLVLDCHREPRTLEVEFDDGPPPRLLEALRPFGRAVVVAPGQLAILDRERYFRLYINQRGVRAILRKAAAPSVFAELVAQLERAVAGSEGGCAACVALCETGALGPASASDVDDARCTGCLACVQHHVAGHHFPVLTDEDDDDDGGEVDR
jgi:ferredoxin